MDQADQQVKSQYAKSIGSLYTIDEKQRPLHCGTCSFIRHSKGLFLCSAQHVFEHVGYTDVHIFTSTGLVPIQFEAYRTTPSATNAIDRIDIVIAKLDHRHDPWSHEFSPIDLTQACSTASNISAPSVHVGLFGYPHSRNRPKGCPPIIRSQAYLISGSQRFNQQLHKRCPINETTHAFMAYGKYRLDRQTSQKQRTVKPHGLSGGLMFDMGVLGKIQEVCGGSTRPPTPIAIITDYIRERDFVAGIKLSVVESIIQSTTF